MTPKFSLGSLVLLEKDIQTVSGMEAHAAFNTSSRRINAMSILEINTVLSAAGTAIWYVVRTGIVTQDGAAVAKYVEQELVSYDEGKKRMQELAAKWQEEIIRSTQAPSTLAPVHIEVEDDDEREDFDEFDED